MASTTIKIDTELKDRLNTLKIHPRESYNDVIERLVAIAVDEEPLSQETIRDLERSLEDLKAGRVYTLDEVMAELKEERPTAWSSPRQPVITSRAFHDP
ncbi:MAG TPA: hypothetical protein PKK41_06000 [Methanoculleus sp.]|jgi:predicted transcriptional regulator|nr:hypothetical protein [Methanoculleus sp.]